MKTKTDKVFTFEGKDGVSRPVDGLVGPLPCPFCGSENLQVCDHGIECRNCGVWMGDGTQCRTIGKTVLDAWNHRANAPLERWRARKD